MFFQIAAKGKGYRIVASLYKNSLFLGSMFSPKVPRAVQKRVSILGGRCGSDGLLPDQLFLTSVRSDGPREFTPTPKSDAPRPLDWAEFRVNRA